MRPNTTGFTLVEAVVALSIVAVLACIAVPAWSNVREAACHGAARSALLDSILAASSHAAIAGIPVVLCPGDARGCRADTDWSRGWVAFADSDGDGTRGAAEPLLRAVPGLGGRAHLRTTQGRTRLQFQPGGGNVGSNATFTLCDGRGTAKAVSLVLANDGRLRGGQPTAAAAADCMQER